MTMTVSDPTSAAASIAVTVKVTNVDEDGTITLFTPQPI